MLVHLPLHAGDRFDGRRVFHAGRRLVLVGPAAGRDAAHDGAERRAQHDHGRPGNHDRCVRVGGCAVLLLAV